jgi:hypothetical protein
MYNKVMYGHQFKNMKRAKVKSDSQTLIVYRHFQQKVSLYCTCVIALIDKSNELESLKCIGVFCKDSLNTEVFQTLCMCLSDYFLITQNM